MTNTDYALGLDGGSDDLPRTVRREKEARQRELREREATGQPAHGFSSGLAPDYGTREPIHHAGEQPAMPAAVTRLEIPFFRLVAFFMKAVFAAIPALLVLGFVLWGAGHFLRLYFPELVKMQILIYFPN